MRPLVLNYPDDPRVWELGHEFLWGDDLLVAPVTREGATRWPVYLPAGALVRLLDAARATRARRGVARRRAARPAAAARARPARSCRWARSSSTPASAPLDEITLLVYPWARAASRFEMYEDDGRSNAYRRGRPRPDPDRCVAEPGRVTVRIGEPAGDRSVVPAGRRYLIRIRIDGPVAVSLAGHGALPRVAGPTDGAAGWWVDADGFTGIRLPPSPPRRWRSPLALEVPGLGVGDVRVVADRAVPEPLRDVAHVRS